MLSIQISEDKSKDSILWNYFEEAISKLSATDKKPVPAGNLDQSRFYFGLKLEEKEVNREEKVAEVEELSGKFAEATIAIVTDYKGLTVPVLQELRHDLRRNDAEFRVAKNTLLIRAVEDTEYKELQDQFVGTTAVTVSSGDPVSPAKILADFSKDHPELKIRAALLDGKLLSVDDITALAKLPGKEVLLGQMLSVMNAVPTGLVQVLSGVPRTFLYALQAIKEQKEQAAN